MAFIEREFTVGNKLYTMRTYGEIFSTFSLDLPTGCTCMHMYAKVLLFLFLKWLGRTVLSDLSTGQLVIELAKYFTITA